MALALQPDRSLASLVPPAVTDASASFAVGGNPEVPQIPGQHGCTPRSASAVPDQRDVAGMVRDRLESYAACPCS